MRGDVQHLPNDTFLVTSQQLRLMHVTDASQNLISSYSVGEGGGIGGPESVVRNQA